MCVDRFPASVKSTGSQRLGLLTMCAGKREQPSTGRWAVNTHAISTAKAKQDPGKDRKGNLATLKGTLYRTDVLKLPSGFSSVSVVHLSVDNRSCGEMSSRGLCGGLSGNV